MNVTVFSAALMMLMASGMSSANESEEDKADAAMKAVSSWSDLRVWYLQTAPVRTAGYTNADATAKITGLLLSGWYDLPLLESMFPETPGFFEFITTHIGESMECRAAQNIAEAAQRACPAGTGELCGELTRRLHTAATGPCAP